MSSPRVITSMAAVVVLVFVAFISVTSAQAPPPSQPAPTPAPPSTQVAGRVLTLEECIGIALDLLPQLTLPLEDGARDCPERAVIQMDHCRIEQKVGADVLGRAHRAEPSGRPRVTRGLATQGELGLHLTDVPREIGFLAPQAVVELRELRLTRLDAIFAETEGGLELDLPSIDLHLALVEILDALA